MNCANCKHHVAITDPKCPGCGTPRPTPEPAFAQAEQSYRNLRREYEAGAIAGEQFDAAVRAQTVDHGGRYWMIGVQSGEWYASDGDAWHQADPPLRATAPTRTETPDIATAKSGGVDWAIMAAAFLIALLCFLYLSRRLF